MAARAKPGLGRGLSALLDEIKAPESAGAQYLPIAQIVPSPMQPRRHFDQAALEELAESIRTRGVLSPIMVRPIGGDKYELVAGERRWRASQLAEMHTIPAMVRELRDGEALQIAIIENVQRADLNAIEEAFSYKRLIDDHGHTQDAVGQLVGKSRSHVTNLLRLLELPTAIREAVVDGSLTMGHARALATASDPMGLMHEVVTRGLSVRETEARAARTEPATAAPKSLAAIARRAARDPDVIALERQLAGTLGLKVAIEAVEGTGRIEVRFDTLDQLDMLCQRLSGGRV